MKTLQKHFVTLVGLSIIMSLLSFWGCSKESTQPEGDSPTPSPQFELSDFSSAEACKSCHPNQYDEWKGSMHAYAFIDPINTAWMDNLRQEVGAEELGQFCVQCHSPIGMLTGETPIGFDKEAVAPLVKEGINCDVCHLMQQPSPTAIGDAVYHYDVKSGNRYGSIFDPAPNTFHTSEGKRFYTQSKACLPCHDLINAQGLRAEITYTEWAESPYIAMGRECQSCHMETYSGEAAVDGPQRDNLHRHDFIGVDVALIENFPDKEVQRQKVATLLRNSVSFQVEVPATVHSDTTLVINTAVINDKTGHDIPSSVTFVRQMWLEVTVTSGADTIYQSGYFDANGDLMDQHSELNPNGDPDLTLFQSALYRSGQPADVFTADSIKIGSIAPFESRSAQYAINIPANLNGSVNVRVRLRFRAIPPYSIREDLPHLIDNIPVFDMASFERELPVIQ